MTSEHTPSKHPLSKKIALTVGSLVVLAGIGLGSLPWILSTSKGTAWFFKQVAAKTGVELQSGDLSLSWFGSQELIDAKGRLNNEPLQFSCPQIISDASLWRILLSQDIGQLTLQNPRLILSKPFKPTSSVKLPSVQAAGMIPDIQLAVVPQDFSWKGNVVVTEGSMRFDAPDLNPLEFEKINLNLQLMGKAGIEGSLNCITAEKASQGTISVTGSYTPKGLDLNALIKTLPTRSIDQLIGLAYPEFNGLFYNLVGPTLDLECSLNTLATAAQIRLKALSPLVNVDLLAESAGGALTLKQPGLITCQLTPALATKLWKIIPSLKTLELTGPTTLQAHIGQWKSPLPFTEADFDETSFQADLTLTPNTTGTFKTIPFTIKSLTVNASSPSLKQEVSWKGSCSIAMQNQVGSFSIEGHLTQPFLSGKEGNISISTQQFPLVILSGIGWDVEPFLGESVDMTASLKLDAAAPSLHLSWNSPLLSLPSLDLSLKGPWTLTAPVSFTYQLSPSLLGTQEISPIQGSIQRFELSSGNWQGLQLEAVLQAEKITLNEPFNQTISDVQISLSANTLNKVSIQVKSDNLNASMSGFLNTKTDTFTLSQPLAVQYALSLPELAKKTNVQLAIDPFTFSLSNPLSNGVKGQIFCPEALFNAGEVPIAIQNIALPFQWDEKGQRLTAQLSSQTKGGGSIQGQLSCSPKNGEKRLELNTASLQGSLSVNNLSSELIDTLTERPYMSVILGSTFSVDLQLKSSLAQQDLSVKWTSPNLSFASSFMLDSTGIQLQSESPVTWNLTPESYRVLDRLVTKERQTAFGLNAPSTFTLTLSKLFLPVTPKQEILALTDRFFPIQFDSTKLELVVNAANKELAFVDKTSKETISLSNLTGSIYKISGQTPFTFNLDSAVSTQSGQNAKAGSLTCSAKIDLPQDSVGGFDLSKLNATIQLQAKQFPSRVLDVFARASGRTDLPFTTLFGPTVHLSLNTDLKDLNGPIQLNFNTPTTQAELDGHLVNGTLLLDRPFFSQLLVTKESSQLLLKEINPLDLSYIYSHAPVTLHIPAVGFSLPIYPWAPEKMTVPDASIELGKVACRNEGNVNITLGLLKSKQFSKDQDLTLWFAPIDLSIKQGLVSVQRTEILISDTFDICTWGNIDLVKEYVDMTLGLTAQTLSKAFGIKGLPENYVLTIPMKGKMDNVQINTGKATAKVALLLAWQHKDLADSLGAGGWGSIAGEVLGAIATLPDANAKIPPARHPFPWEVGQGQKPPSRSKKKTFKTSDKPLKQIFKVIR